MPAPLEQELQTFERLKTDLLTDEGKYAVKRKLAPFLVKKILAVEPVHFVFKPFRLCHT